MGVGGVRLDVDAGSDVGQELQRQLDHHDLHGELSERDDDEVRPSSEGQGEGGTFEDQILVFGLLDFEESNCL